MSRQILVLLAAGLLVVPLVQAQEDAGDDLYTRLYSHVTIHGDEAVTMNTIFPEGEDDYSAGDGVFTIQPEGVEQCEFGEDLLYILPYVPACDPVYDVAENELWSMQYNAEAPFKNWDDFVANGRLTKYTEDHELLKGLEFSATDPLTMDFHMSADATMWMYLAFDTGGDIPWPLPHWNSDYGIFPGWVINSRAYSVGPESMAAYNISGIPAAIRSQQEMPDVTMLAEGFSEPFDMISLPTTIPDAQVVYHVNVDLGPSMVPSVPAGDTLWWWVDWYSDLSGYGIPAKVLWGQNFAINSGEFFPPSLNLPLANAMDIEMVMPQFTDDNKLVVIALFNSPFGAYDVPLDSASFEILDPDGRVIATQDDKTVTWMQKAAREQQSLLGVSPDAALKRGQATWLWNYLAEEDIRPGDYTIRVTAENAQGKAASKEAYFSISEGLGKGGVTSSLGGMFTFSKEDIKKLEECHGCHDAATGELLSGVQDLTMAEAKAMQADGTLDVDGSGGTPAEKKSPGIGLVVLLGALAVAARRRR